MQNGIDTISLFKNANGENLKIAIIDTGIKIDHKDFANANIEAYKYDYISSSVVPATNEDKDEYGHGTACAWIVHRKASKAHIISIKALDNNGIGTGESIISSLRWCIDNNINIINLSLGTYDNDYIDVFQEMVELAILKNIIIFASASESESMPIPARLEHYFCVKSQNNLSSYEFIWHESSKIVFAKGGRQRVGWIGPEYIYIAGNSFATAHMSAIAILIKQIYAPSSVDKFLNILKEKSSFSHYNKQTISNNSMEKIQFHNAKMFELNKVLIVPLTKESLHLYRFKHMLSFQISYFVDLSRTGRSLKYQYADIDLNSDKILHSLSEALNHINEFDTVIISRTHLLDDILGYDVLRTIVDFSIKNKKNIYSLEYLDYFMYPDLYITAKNNRLKIRHPMIFRDNLAESIQYRELYGHLGSDTPIIGVFGTGSQQGKFTVQMMLRKCLKETGYNVVNLGTEVQSELFEFEGFYPMEIENSVKFDNWDMMVYIQGQIRKFELTKPDIIIVGSQSGVVPQNYAVASSHYTLHSIAFLMATVPHAYILTLNPDDDVDYIWNTIHALESIGKGKVILLVFSDNPRTVLSGSNVIINKKLSEPEIESIINKLESIFNICATEIISINGQKKLISTIINYFS